MEHSPSSTRRRRTAPAWAGVVGLVAGLALTVPAPAVSAVSCGGLVPTITGTRGQDVLTGTPGPDVIAGLTGGDTIRGLGGDDVLCGNDGSDLLVGGEGDDRLYGGRSGFVRRSGDYVPDTLQPGPGDDFVDGGIDTRPYDWQVWELDTLDFSRSEQAVHVDLGAGTADGEGHDQVVVVAAWGVTGSDFDDVITGSSFGDHLYGERGADTIDGAAGDDYLTGDSAAAPDGAADVLLGGEGTDHLHTTSGADEQSGGPGSDELYDLDDDDDVLRGGDDGDSLAAVGGGRDQLYGEGGDDWLSDALVPGPGQVVDGGPGWNSLRLQTRFIRDQTVQRVSGTTDLRDGTTTVDWPETTTVDLQHFGFLDVPARWVVWGTDAAEGIRGATDGPVTIHAGGGDDHLIGTPYADLLDGGDGTDRAEPGRGDDTCVAIEETDRPGNACDPSGVIGPAELVSVGSTGTPTDRVMTEGYRPQVSADGRYVVFATPSALVPDDTNGVADVYVRDRTAGVTSRVSVTSSGRQLVRASGWGDISADGRFVAFESRGAAAHGLEPGTYRVFVHDALTGRTTLVSLDESGRRSFSGSLYPSISGDGNRIAFLAYGRDPDDAGIYLRDRAAQQTTLVTVRTDGTPSPAVPGVPTISSDGQSVVFATTDAELTDPPRHGLLVRDLSAGRTTWVDTAPASYDGESSISADGRVVAYTQVDPECVGPRTDCTVVKVRNVVSGRLWTPSVTPDGRRPDGGSLFPVISGNGRFVLFTSWADDLVPEDTNATADVFIRLLHSGITMLVSTDQSGGPADGPSGSFPEGMPGVAFSDDGGWIVYETRATDMVPGDTNGVADVVVRSWQPWQ